MPILFLFIIVPVIEIYVLLKVGGFIGAFPTVLIILATAFIGYKLFRAQGLAKLNSVRSTMSGQAGGDLAMDVAEGAAILLAGALLLTPGFVTDAFGFACLIPPIRKVMIKSLISKGIMRAQTSNYSTYQTGPSHAETPENPNIIEGEYKEK